jgi:uncharacterized protein
MAEHRTVDADMHVRDTESLLKQYLPERHCGRPRLYPTENFDRGFGGRLGKNEVDARIQVADMEPEGIDLAILFPTTGLSMGEVREPDLAIALSRAYDDWIADYCRAAPDRLKGVALLQLLDPEEAAVELERAVGRLGLVGGGGAGLHPLRAPQPRRARRRPGLCRRRAPRRAHRHPRQRRPPRSIERFGRFVQVHTFSHVPEQMAAVTATVLGGVFERFPRLRMGFMEAGCGWLPFWLEHMDEEFELRRSEAPELTARPSEYLTCGRAFFGVEPEERLIALAAEMVGDGQLLYASDYPHWDRLAEHGAHAARAGRSRGAIEGAHPGPERARLLRPSGAGRRGASLPAWLFHRIADRFVQ